MTRAVVLFAAASLAGCHPHPATILARTANYPHTRPPRAARNQTAPRRPTVPVATTTVIGTPADLGTFTATCYSPPQFPAGQRTASGQPVGPGSIAADVRLLPIGTRLEVDGWGSGVVDDTGGAIRGRRLDVWLPSLAACVRFGRRTVHVRRIGP